MNTFIYRTSFVWMCSLGNITQYNTAKGKRSRHGVGRPRATGHTEAHRKGIHSKGFSQPLFFPLPGPAVLFTQFAQLILTRGSFSPNLPHFLFFQLLVGFWAAVKTLPAGPDLLPAPLLRVGLYQPQGSPVRV